MAASDTRPIVLMVLESTFPVSGGGGAESQVISLGRCLLARGFSVEVLVPMVSGGPQLEFETFEGLHITRIRYPQVRLLGGAIMLVKLAALLVARRHRYAVIHAHIASNMAAVTSLVGHLMRRRVIVKLTGMKEMQGGILDPSPSVVTLLRKFGIRRASYLQATSARIARLLVERGFDASRVLLVPNGVSVERFSVPMDLAFRQRMCGSARLVALFVGRLAPEKGHEMLLLAWGSVFAGRGDVKLLLVGDGPMRHKLAALARELSIEDQVVFAGHADDVAPFIAIADLGLLTSLAEGLSNALLEYMAGGLPVIGSRVSGTEDFVIPGETGWLFEPGQRSELAQCLREAGAVETSELKSLGKRARGRVVASASLDAVTDRLIGHYGVSSVSMTGMLPAK
jgi:glycosyltransferase involved in cell wall biosynthesis